MLKLRKIKQHAIVIGASMTGLFAARVLSRYFDDVTIIERDELPDDPSFRGGTPQARHAHALLAEGQETMEELFPQLTQDFIEAGAPLLRWGEDSLVYSAYGWLKRFDTGIETRSCSRIWLESRIRSYVRDIPNVQIKTGWQVTGLGTHTDEPRIVSVQVTPRQGSPDEKKYLVASLIVDASGRTSQARDWLQGLGYAVPEEERINGHLGYSSRWYRMPEDAPDDWIVMNVASRPKEGLYRAGGIYRVEDDQWVAIMLGANGDYPPTDADDFMEFARSLAHPVVYEALQTAEPISPVYGFRRTENCWYHYEKLDKLPERFIVMGDALCHFNPVYGQGMTVAALEAKHLDTLLRERGMMELDGLTEAFYQRVHPLLRDAWAMSTGQDKRVPLNEGKYPQSAIERWIDRYMDDFSAMMPHDERLAIAFIKTMNLKKSPAYLLHPRLMLRVLRNRLLHPEMLNTPPETHPRDVPQSA